MAKVLQVQTPILAAATLSWQHGSKGPWNRMEPASDRLLLPGKPNTLLRGRTPSPYRVAVPERQLQLHKAWALLHKQQKPKSKVILLFQVPCS